MSSMTTDLIAAESAEHAVIGSILIDAAGYAAGRDLDGHPTPDREPYRDNALAVAKARLTPDDFTLIECRVIYEAMLAADADGVAVDVVSLAPYLDWQDNFGLLVRLGDPNVTPSAANVGLYVHQVADATARRRLQLTAEGMAVFAADTTESLSAVLDRAEDGVAEARKSAAVDVKAFDLLAEIEDTRASLDGRDESQWRWQTGVDFIDKRFGGIGIGEHWVVGGRSGHMKTALACNIMLGTLQAGHRTVMFRYEENRRRMYLRLASLVAGVPYCVEPYSEAAGVIDEALSQLADFDGLLEVHLGLNMPQCEGVVQRFKPSLVIYDTLQAMTEAVGKAHEARRDLEVQSICQHASRLCMTPGNEHAALLISQLQKGEGQPTMRQLRETAAIGENADVALLLWWPYKERDMADPDKIVIRVGKQRDGLPGKTVCYIEPTTQRFGARMQRDAADMFLSTL